MAFTTFVYDTLDVCTRLGRYIIQELTGLAQLGRPLARHRRSRPACRWCFLLRGSVDAAGNPVPVWRTFWFLFGASNQLLAALTLLGVTVWLWRTRRAAWVWFVTGMPTVVMYTMSTWALAKMTLPRFYDAATGQFAAPADPVPWAGIVLIALAALMLVEAVRAIASSPAPPSGLQPALA